MKMQKKNDDPENDAPMLFGGNKKRWLFRETALERAERDRDLDELVELVPRRLWLLYLAALTLFLGVVAWRLLG